MKTEKELGFAYIASITCVRACDIAHAFNFPRNKASEIIKEIRYQNREYYKELTALFGRKPITPLVISICGFSVEEFKYYSKQ